MYILVISILVAVSGETIASNSFIEIPESLEDPVALIFLPRNELKTLVCKWPKDSGNEFHSLVYSNENKTLNRSSGGDLTFRIYTTCKLSGRFVCQSWESQKMKEDRKLDLLVTNCNSQIHPERDKNRTISGKLNTDVQLTYRVTAAINSSNYPILNVNSRYLTTTTADEKYSFTFDPISSIDYSMGLIVKNITQEDYGSIVIILNTGVNTGVLLNLYINPPGSFNRTINYLCNTATLICESSWYPKSVSISKELNNLEDLIMSTENNTLLRKETVQIQSVLPDLGSCSDIGMYKCTITDFRGNSYIIKSSVHIDNCAPLLCWPSVNLIDVKVKINETASLTVCIKGPLSLDLTNISVSIYRNGIELKHSRYMTDIFRREESRLYHYLRLNVSDVQSSDHGIYVVNVTFTSIKQSFSVNFNVIVELPPVFCSNTYNDTIYNITIGQNETIKLCVQTSASVTKVEVNKKPVGISDAPNDQREDTVYINQTIPGLITVHKRLSSIAVQTIKTYSVKVWLKSGYTITYVFRLNIIGQLKLCEGETSIKVVYVHPGSNASAHICVTSDLGPFREIGVNGHVLCVNKFNRTRDVVGVTSHRKHDSMVTDYYIQLHVQNVSKETPLNYDVLIRPTNMYHLNISVQLKILNNSQLRQCRDSLTKTYIMASRSDPVTSEVCVLTTGNARSILVNGRNEYPKNINVSYRSRQINGIRDHEGEERREYMVDIEMWNMTRSNFSRYVIEILFDTNLTWTHVFYLLDKEDSLRCPSLKCHSGEKIPDGLTTMCVHAYGDVYEQVKINGQLYEVEQKYSSRTNSINCEENLKCLRYRTLGVTGSSMPPIQVFGEWDQNVQRYLIIKLSQRDSKTLHNVTIVTTGLVYTLGTEEISETSTSLLSSSLVLIQSTFPRSASAPLPSSSSLFMESTLRSLELQSQKLESDHSKVVLAAVVISVVAFVVFSITVCVFVFKGSWTSRKVDPFKIKRSSSAAASYQRESREISRLLNTTLSSQGTERCLLNLSDYQPSTPSRNTSATYSTLSAEYITPLDL